jgi:hypothetical protein
MESFEERLYNNKIYTNTLYNMSWDMLVELGDQFGDNIHFEEYVSGKYFTIKIDDSEILNQAVNHIEYICDKDKNYFEGLKYKVDGNKILLYIEI